MGSPLAAKFFDVEGRAVMGFDPDRDISDIIDIRGAANGK